MRRILQLLVLGLTVCFTIGVNAQSYKLPPFEIFKLKNGLTVYLVEQHEVPVINVSVILPSGAIYDGEKAGLATMTATALKHGTKNFTKEKLDEALDFQGASLNTSASKESAGITVKMASKDKDKILHLLQEVLLAPTFDSIEFDKEKRRMLIGLEQQKESPGAVIGSYFDKFMYGDHVYGNIVQGTISTVAALSLNDVKKFYSDNYLPEGSAIAVAGDFNKPEMKTLITTLFSDWKKGSKPQINLASKPLHLPTKQQVILINKDDAKETTFYIGAPGISRNNPDYVSIEVVNTLFGGRFTSMLNDELRVNSGLTYGAYSKFSTLKNGGTFLISTFTEAKTTEPAIDKALEVLKKLHTSGFDERSLTSAKNYIKGQFPPRFETAGQLAALLTQMFWFNFDESFINNFETNVNSLTLDKAKQIVSKYFPKDKLQLILVGKSADINKVIQKYGPVTEVQLKEGIKKA